MLERTTDPSGAVAVKGQVLLVDDEQQVLSAYARMLRGAGFAVVEVSDGSLVESALEVHDFDLVVSDIGLPGMNGIDVLRVVHERDPDLPVVLITAGGDLNSAVKAVELGALRYLLKPVAPAVLRDTATDAIKLRQIAKMKRRAFELFGNAASRDSERAELSLRFDHALSTLYMAYQPIVAWSRRRVFAYEALVRTEEASLMRPDALFSAAESLGRLFEIGRAIRNHVARTMCESSVACVFVNLHPRDLEDEDLLSPTSPLSLVASRVVLEITERASLEKVSDVKARLATLRRMGFRLAVDDLGAGYAGLSTFAQLEPEVVKLDMSLVRGVDSEPTKRKLIGSMTKLCGELGMLVVAEGVETAAERDTLVALGCDLLQGYFFAKPARPFPAVAFDPEPQKGEWKVRQGSGRFTATWAAPRNKGSLEDQ